MAQVTLHDYCEEARELIRTDSYDEAIAICRHILQHFPKHVASYHLLGEACLERGEYVDAANLLKRVLGSDLEDVIAYVGLGIIFDEEGALEEAIWQLERAFELSPGNAEIRGELRRLYGERDETEPTRLKLTRAALGRLYLKEELYERAIDEFRAVLEQDPERADIQVALAEALHRSDQRQEASTVCEQILEEFPNCLKANLILGEILLSSGREEEGWVLLRTAQAMDPENIAARELFGDQSPFPSKPVYVHRLEEAELKERIKEITPAVPAPVREVEPEEEALPSLAEAELEEAMPDWLRKLREGERRPAAEEGVSAVEAEEIPEWLRGVGERIPEEEKERPTVPGEEVVPTAEEVPAWLRELEGVSEAPGPQEVGPPVASEEEEGEPPEAVVEEGPAEEALEEGTLPTAEKVPDWLRQARAEALEEEVAPAPGAEEEMPDWLRALREEGAEPVLPEEAAAPLEPVAEEREPTLGEVEKEPPVEATLEEELEISEETMARLRKTMPDESASIDEVMAWLERSSAIIDREGKPRKPAKALEEEREVDEVPSPPREEEVPGWAQELRAEAMAEEAEPHALEEVDAPVEELEVPPEEEELPGWLQELRAEAAKEGPEPAAVEEAEVPVEEEAPLRPEEIAAEVGEEEAEPAAIEKVEVAAEEETVPAEEEELPPWLRELRAEAVEEEAEPAVVEEVEAAFEEAPVAEEEELPAWLRELRAEALEEEAKGVPIERAEAPAEVLVVPSEEEVPTLVEEPEVEEAVPLAVAEEEPPAEMVPEAEVVGVPPAVEEAREEVAEAAWSVEDYLSHLASSPEDDDARLGLARSYSQQGDLDQALSHYRKFVSSGTRLDEVVDDLEAVADELPDDLPTHELLADAYMKQGRLQKALDKYRWLRGRLSG